ncbi:YicC family protein [Gemmobacter fulvus]|uniref:YicC family protein n=1 Tax=Gemmobacter fulvus TaxID=2840474 RepID=A0A975S1L7_9RHOB|nr:YicC/YloC family endoribonuclease [Gemmobacter fulvus]MBT9245229.1 YicC family protein [Gemmobacter fulvus]QWK90441.1 YicC family protein [Gemmobacter fulvus]
MTVSMTGFAARKGQGAGISWAWDLRAVNGKGLDLRLRVPDWIDGLELALRNELGRALSRGNVNLTLRVSRDLAEGSEALRLNLAALRAVLTALGTVETVAMETGVTLKQATQADVLAFRGVIEAGTADEDTAPLRAALLADLTGLLAEFNAMRAAEGAALQGVITAQLDQIDALTQAATAQVVTRKATQTELLHEAVARILSATDADPARLAQELALLAVKTDVTEELDRLRAHVAAARSLLAEPGPVGRKFDFLMQEFMREANTLCSKAQDLALTRIGLDLKTVIDQMREQVQNVE